MDREQMIEKGVDALVACPTTAFRDQSRAILDAVLPQVTTVEELEALPCPALLLGALVGRLPAVFRWTNGQLYYEDGSMRLTLQASEFGPLTVVWQP